MNTVMSHISKRHVAELRYNEACNKAVSLEELFRRHMYMFSLFSTDFIVSFVFAWLPLINFFLISSTAILAS